MSEDSQNGMVHSTFDAVKPGLLICAHGENGASITQHAIVNEAMATIIVNKQGDFVLQSDGNGPGLVLLLPTLRLQSPIKVTRVRIVRRTKRAAIGKVIG